eukprot:CAMPEP_0117448902 /NCGR_PEP_ID=MMETSP0759-20121206/7651_1 /TAXON_ID=63605 /ORGANISM="Percolomonas cosmopolitus, Strain WS" /LENGTH=1533 /DNA_ID=CAMNT_0005241325 /DNA_START=194 /DNA_END=4791 /DNA_ORIENTATION=-
MDENSNSDNDNISPPTSPQRDSPPQASKREGSRRATTSRRTTSGRSQRKKRAGRREHSRRRKPRVRDDPVNEDRELEEQNNVAAAEDTETSPRRKQSRMAPDEENLEKDNEDADSEDQEAEGEGDDDELPAPVEDPVEKDLFRTVPHILSSRETALPNNLHATRITHSHPVTLSTLKKIRAQKENIAKIGAKYRAKSEKSEHKKFLAVECERQEKSLSAKVEKLEEEYSAVYRRVDKEKEGLFVNKPSFLMKHNRHIVEQRAFRSEGGISSCFDENGQLLYLSNPLKSIFTKPDEQEFDTSMADQIELKKTRPVLSTLTTSSDRPEYRLDIDIKMIKFKDHELMIEEEYLVRQLLDMFDSYTNRSKSSLIEYYSDKIKALEQSLSQMRDKMRALQQQHNPMEEDTLRANIVEDHISVLDRRMHKIRQELKENRKLLQEERTHQVDIVNNIIRTWNQIKEVRKRQGFMVARYGVTFQQIDHNEAEDLQDLEQEVEHEVEEAREDAEYEFRQKQQIFDRTVINDDDSLAEFPMLPETPDFDDHKIRKSIKKLIMSGRRAPGAPEFVPQIGSIVRNEQQISESEEERGIAFRRYKYFIKVCINGHTVNHTKTKRLNRDFTVVFGEILPISLHKWPDNIVLQVYRKENVVRSRKVASIFVQAPGGTLQGESSDLGNAVSENSSLEQNFIFSEEKNHPALWNENSMHNNTGEVKVRLNWVDQIPPYQPSKKDIGINSKKVLTDDTHMPNAKDLLDMQNIQKWMKGNKIDPNDPKNTGLMSMLELLEDKILTRQGFYLAEQDDDLFISSFNDMRYKKRLEMLKAMDDAYSKRKRKQFVSKYVREPPLPALNWGILSSLWAFFEPRRPLKPTRRDRTQEVPRRIEEANLFIQVIRGHNIPVRATTNEFYKHRERMYQQKEQILDQQQNTNRSLRPGATSVMDTPLLADQSMPTDDVQDESVVSFVSCFFQGRTRKTKIVEGPYPQFNQTINMPISVPNHDFSSDVIKSIKDVLYFDIFDELTITNVKDDQYLHDLSKRAEFRWIGGFSIPFSTLYRAGKVLGTFTVKTPPINLGYKYRDENDQDTRLTICITVDPPLPQPEDITDSISSGELPALFSYVNWWTKIMENNPNCKNRIITAMEPNNYGKTTLICRYITPQKPPAILFTGDDFQQTTAASEMLTSDEEEERNRHTGDDSHLEENDERSPQNTTVVGEDTAAITSNVNISTLPHDKKQLLVHKCARFVSLIPFVDDIVAFLERTDVWQTSQEFLADGGGDDEEHANLLCNYFKYLQKKTWVVVGRAVPEGEASYVLTEEEREVESRTGFSSTQKYYLLWNAATGEAFDTTDPMCPIYEVGTIFDETNVWSNIQRSAKPHLISFDLNNRSHWQPLFRGSKMKTLLPGGVITTIQERNLVYRPIASGVSITMEFEIMNDVKTGVEDNRKDVTIWSTHVGKELRQILIELEKCKQNNEKFSRKKQALMLKSITDTHHVIGFPLNFTYVNNETIVREVLNTKIHEHQDSDVRFACGVYVHPYVNNVFS